MRTLLVSVIAGALLALVVLPLGGGEVSADNPPHVKGAAVPTDSCAGCHRAHTGQAKFILKEDQPGLCYSCHGTGGVGSDLDVQDGKVRSTSAALKGGGLNFALIDTADPSVKPNAQIGVLPAAEAVTSSHTVDGSAGTLWGNDVLGTPGAGGSYNLRCGACHDPHGNQKYRILRPSPPGSGGSGQDVTDESPKDYDTTDYFDDSYVAADEISGWCSQCHTRYLASPGSATSPSGDTIYTYRHTSDGTGSFPTCIQCHAAHGSNATTDDGGYSEGVPWPDGSAATGENSRLLKMDNRGICQKCHNK